VYFGRKPQSGDWNVVTFAQNEGKNQKVPCVCVCSYLRYNLEFFFSDKLFSNSVFVCVLLYAFHRLNENKISCNQVRNNKTNPNRKMSLFGTWGKIRSSKHRHWQVSPYRILLRTPH
jgi:hypothetical protein